MLIYRDFRSEILKVLHSAIPELDEKDLYLDRTGHGDYALKGFRYARGGNFEELCEKVRRILLREEYIESVSCEVPYINITIKPESIFTSIDELLTTRSKYPDTFQEPDRVLIEHTSTNPTGPIHVGRSRNSIIGDSLYRLFRRAGYRTSTQYFVNDSGKQVMAMVVGNRLFSGGRRDVASILEGYQKVYREIEGNTAIEEKIQELMRKYEEGDEQVIGEVRDICSITLEGIKKSLRDVDIVVDDYVFESSFLTGGQVQEIIEKLGEHVKLDTTSSTDGSKNTNDRDALYLELPGGKKVYLQRSDGTSLYFLRDLAYHNFKAQTSDWIIDVLGEDHKDHGKSLSYVLKELLDYPAKIDFVFYAFVSLEAGKMSTRKGTAVSLDDLIERAYEEAYRVVKDKRKDLKEEQLRKIARSVGISSIRFNIVRIHPDKRLVFRWSDALNFEGDSAPYIMYSYARASSILRKVPDAISSHAENFNTEERNLVKTLYLYPHYLSESLSSLRPDIMANYALDLVKRFSDFYSKHSVLKAPKEEMGKRISLIRMYRAILADVCDILGIRLLDEM